MQPKTAIMSTLSGSSGRASEFPWKVPMKTDTTTRSDLDALTALNNDYIHSVQHSDVRRFDEILAEDFLCSNPDGSLVDKNQFLAQTARPVTISGLLQTGDAERQAGSFLDDSGSALPTCPGAVLAGPSLLRLPVVPGHRQTVWPRIGT